eukprot:478831-Prorocentrum_minimum.AAC.1
MSTYSYWPTLVRTHVRRRGFRKGAKARSYVHQGARALSVPEAMPCQMRTGPPLTPPYWMPDADRTPSDPPLLDVHNVGN